MLGKALREMLILLLQTYQKTLSMAFGPSCRFYPSCSCYAIEAIERHGVIHGGWLTLKRLIRCHPFNPGGYDPVESESN